ncbi:MAG: FRG domain-containing protein, partial [Fusobacteriaceae bacterium]
MIIYENIFDAIEVFEKNSCLIKLKNNHVTSLNLKRNNTFEAIETEDGKIGAIPPRFLGVSYRGENQVFPSCKASIYRSNNKIERMRDEIKIIDFELILKKIPEVIEAEKNNQYINFLALAQHYELNTSLIDITSDLAVAAFFAVNKYNSEIKEYEIMENGIGVIKRLFNPIMFDENFEFIGYQIFKRPTYQHAFGIKTLGDVEEQPRFEKVYFKHSKIDNQKITSLFLKENKNELFPEEYISKIAKFLKNTNSVTK